MKLWIPFPVEMLNVSSHGSVTAAESMMQPLADVTTPAERHDNSPAIVIEIKLSHRSERIGISSVEPGFKCKGRKRSFRTPCRIYTFAQGTMIHHYNFGFFQF